jgi:lambda repressor-like predicted transcriptional regulator
MAKKRFRGSVSRFYQGVALTDPHGAFVITRLGTFLQEQLRVLGWSRATLATRTGLDEWTLEGILDSPVLPEWPQPDEMLALSRALCVSVREITLRAAEGCGLSVLGGIDHNEAVMLATNDELMREVRRRLALGARTGQYLTSAGQQLGLDTAQSA